MTQLRNPFAILAAACIAWTQTVDAQPADVQLSPQVMTQLLNNPDRFVEYTIQQLFNLAPNGKLTREAVATRDEMETAQQRANRLGVFFGFDLDGDLEISAAEIDRQMPYLNSNQSAKFQFMIATVDLDRDGSLSLKEMWRQAATSSGSKRFNVQQGEELMKFDANRDGIVTPEEIAAVVKQIAPVRQANEASAAAASIPDGPVRFTECEFPKPSDDAEIVLIGGYQGYAVSTVALAGQDHETSAAVINIEAGKTPLYILATAFDPIVWKVTGAIDRVERFVVPGYSRGVGVVGLSKDVAHFELVRGCLPKYFKSNDSGEAVTAKGLIASKLERNVDHVVGSYKLGEIGLPSGNISGVMRGSQSASGLTIIKGNRQFIVTEDGVTELAEPAGSPTKALEKKLERLLLRHYRGGILEVAPEDVVTNRDVERYDVLPQQAGLLQLARKGAITQTPDGYFKIVKPIIRFPAGLNGGHRVRFILGVGVPMPGGSPGHSLVISEETGTCVTGSQCR